MKECRVVVAASFWTVGRKASEKEQRSQGPKEVKEGDSHVDTWRKSILGRGSSKCKVPEARPCLGPCGYRRMKPER